MRLNLGLVFLLILQDAQPLLFDVLELSAVNRPAQHGQNGQDQQNGDGDEDVEDFHDRVWRFKRERRRV